MCPIKFTERLVPPDKSETGKDLVKCHFCDKLQECDNFYVWLEGQTAIRTLKCKVCDKNSVVKLFTEVTINIVQGKIEPQPKYCVYSAPETATKQVHGQQCLSCTKPIYVQVIDQTRFFNKESVRCPCGTINQVCLAGPSAKNGSQKRERNPKNIAHKSQKLATQNRFSVLESYEPFKQTTPKTTVESENYDSIDTDDSRSITSDLSRRSKRKLPESPEGVRSAVKKPTHVRSYDEQGAENTERTETTETHPTLQKEKNSTGLSMNQRKKRLPVIVCTNTKWLDDQVAFKKSTLLAKKHECKIKTEKSTGKFLFTPSTLDGRNALIEDLKNLENCEFYTHGTKLERQPSKKVVAKGVITLGYDEKEVIEDISERYGMSPERAIPLKNSAVLLIFAGDTHMQDIRKIEYILCQKVKIEKYRIKLTAVTQCKRCLQFGHVQAHCNRKAKSDTQTNTKDDGEEIEVCSNCQEPGHTARQAKFPYFKEEIKRQKERRQKFLKTIDTKRKEKESDRILTSDSTIRPGVLYSALLKPTQPTVMQVTQMSNGELLQELNNTLHMAIDKLTTLVQSLNTQTGT